jgi:hypothetical protein
MTTIAAGQTVADNADYETSVSGDFGPEDLVPCHRKNEQSSGTCAFLPVSILGHESGH